MADFGPRITIKIVESLRDDIYAGKLKSGPEIKVIILDIYILSFSEYQKFVLLIFECFTFTLSRLAFLIRML